MVKSGLSPTSSAWRRRILTPIEWKVPSQGMPSTTWPTMSPTRSLHLPRRLVGEGDGEDLARSRAALAQDVGDARRQHPRLAGAGAGQHQQRPVEGLDRLSLLGIEPGEIGRRSHPARTRSDAAGGRGRRGQVVIAKVFAALMFFGIGQDRYRDSLCQNKMALAAAHCEGRDAGRCGLAKRRRLVDRKPRS